jgi:hypothetical protein
MERKCVVLPIAGRFPEAVHQRALTGSPAVLAHIRSISAYHFADTLAQS